MFNKIIFLVSGATLQPIIEPVLINCGSPVENQNEKRIFKMQPKVEKTIAQSDKNHNICWETKDCIPVTNGIKEDDTAKPFVKLKELIIDDKNVSDNNLHVEEPCSKDEFKQEPSKEIKINVEVDEVNKIPQHVISKTKRKTIAIPALVRIHIIKKDASNVNNNNNIPNKVAEISKEQLSVKDRLLKIHKSAINVSSNNNYINTSLTSAKNIDISPKTCAASNDPNEGRMTLQEYLKRNNAVLIIPATVTTTTMAAVQQKMPQQNKKGT